jgi:peptide deformylase
MMKRILNIAQIGAPVLRESTKRLKREELLSPPIQEFIDDLIHTMRSANGAGLAANQVHQSLRICAIEVKNNPRYPAEHSSDHLGESRFISGKRTDVRQL